MDKPARRSIFLSPGCGTLFLALPGFGLIVLALIGTNLQGGSLRPSHVISLFHLFYSAPLMIMGGLGSLLVLLAIITLVRSQGASNPPPPSWRWALPPLLIGLLFSALVGLGFTRAKKQIQDVDNEARRGEMHEAKLSAEDEAPPIGDWTQWRGPRRDGISRETGLNLDWSAGPPPLLWKKPIHGGYSSVAVSDGRAYITDREHKNERVVCLDATTGDELWVYSYPNDYRGLEFGEGPRATPTVFDGRVYTVGATGTMLCLEVNPADKQPKLLWRHDLMTEFATEPPRWGVACSPLIEGQFTIVQPGGPNGSVAAFDRVTGQLAWKALTDVAGYSSPIAGTLAGMRQVVCFTGTGLAGLRPGDGQQLWYFPWETDFEGNIATPILAGDYVFITSSYGKGCALVKIIADGSAFRVEEVYVRSNKLLRCHHSTCVLHNGFLYGFDYNTNNDAALLKCVDLRTAEQSWPKDPRKLENPLLSAKGTLLYADGHLIVLTEDGELASVEATPDAFRKKGSFAVFKTRQTWALPSVANGRLYVRDGKEAQCYELKK